MNHWFTLYAPYVAIPHISIISREMAEAMHMSAAERAQVSLSLCKVTLVEAHSVPNQIYENVHNMMFS